MFRDLVAGFCDEQRAVLIEEMDGAHLVLLAHQGDRLADETVGLLDEIVEQVVDIVRDAGRLLPAGWADVSPASACSAMASAEISKLMQKMAHTRPDSSRM